MSTTLSDCDNRLITLSTNNFTKVYLIWAFFYVYLGYFGRTRTEPLALANWPGLGPSWSCTPIYVCSICPSAVTTCCRKSFPCLLIWIWIFRLIAKSEHKVKQAKEVKAGRRFNREWRLCGHFSNANILPIHFGTAKKSYLIFDFRFSNKFKRFHFYYVLLVVHRVPPVDTFSLNYLAPGNVYPMQDI